MSYKEKLITAGLNDKQDLRVTKSLLEKQWDDCNKPTRELTVQLSLVTSILEYPE